ncbi:hypothetical protein UY3_14797 [Chelonia mydas]|uniref:Uncharacterized protein n=1 Tax=Chelonia mydas TaxID=8469 RepID=M7AS23_CHEMY|nr:hypothetical protein UY3_14797 [Chelonia mydas]
MTDELALTVVNSAVNTFLTVPVLTELKHEASGAGEYSSDRKPLTSPARAICIGGDYSCHLASPSPLMQNLSPLEQSFLVVGNGSSSGVAGGHYAAKSGMRVHNLHTLYSPKLCQAVWMEDTVWPPMGHRKRRIAGTQCTFVYVLSFTDASPMADVGQRASDVPLQSAV